MAVLAASLAGAQGSGTMQELNVLGKLKIPIYNALPAAAEFKKGAVIYQYTGADSGIYIRSYTAPAWNKVWPVIGGGGGGVDTFYYRLRPVPGDSTKWVFDRSDRTDTLDLTNAITGGDTTVLNHTLDSTGRPQGEWVFSGQGRKLTSSPYFLYDSALRKVTINSLNVSYGGPGVRFAVNGAAFISDLYLDGSTTNIGPPPGGTYPMAWNPSSNQVEKYTQWQKGVVSFSKNVTADSFILVLDDGSRIALKDSTGAGGGGISGIGTFSATGNANGLSISGSNLIGHPATSTQPGMVSTTDQTWNGVKSFSSTVKLANAGPSMYLLDGGAANRVGISNYGARVDFFTTDAGSFNYYGGGDFIAGAISPWMAVNSSGLTLGSGVSLNLGAGTTFKTSNSGIGALTGSITLVDGGAGAKTLIGKYGNDMHFVGNATSAYAWYGDGDVAWLPSVSTMYLSPGAGLHVTPTSFAAIPASAQFSVSSTTKGFLPPRMTTTQRDAIATPATGLIVYNTTTTELNQYNGSAWVPVGAAGFTYSQAKATNSKFR